MTPTEKYIGNQGVGPSLLEDSFLYMHFYIHLNIYVEAKTYSELCQHLSGGFSENSYQSILLATISI